MKRTLNLLTLLLLTAACNAQFLIPDKAMCQKLEGRKLLVALLDDQNENSRLNSYLKEVTTAGWKYGAVEFIADPMDLEEKVKGAKSQYAVMNFGNDASAIKGWVTTNMSTNVGTNGMTQTRTYSQVDRFTTSYFSMMLSLPDKGLLLEVGTKFAQLDSMDILFMMQQTNLLIDAALNDKDILSFGKTFAEYSKRKLYINEADLPANGKDFLAKNMKAPYEVLPAAQFEKLVMEGKADGLYTKTVYSQEMKMNVIAAVEIKTGRIYARARHSGSDCKNTQFVAPGGSANMNFIGMCPKQITLALYHEGEQTRKYNF